MPPVAARDLLLARIYSRRGAQNTLSANAIGCNSQRPSASSDSLNFMVVLLTKAAGDRGGGGSGRRRETFVAL